MLTRLTKYLYDDEIGSSISTEEDYVDFIATEAFVSKGAAQSSIAFGSLKMSATGVKGQTVMIMKTMR